MVARYIQFVVTHVPHLTSAPLREADIHLENCSIHDVPQRQSPNATHMLGFSERFVGSYPQVWNQEMMNDFMPEDIKAAQEKQQEEIDAAKSDHPYVPPDVFKVSPASSSSQATSSKAQPSTRTYGRSVPSKKPRTEEPKAAPKERTPSEIEWDAMVEQEEIMANPDLWTWV